MYITVCWYTFIYYTHFWDVSTFTINSITQSSFYTDKTTLSYQIEATIVPPMYTGLLTKWKIFYNAMVSIILSYNGYMCNLKYSPSHTDTNVAEEHIRIEQFVWYRIPYLHDSHYNQYPILNSNYIWYHK